jgi:hypothetical protein
MSLAYFFYHAHCGYTTRNGVTCWLLLDTRSSAKRGNRMTINSKAFFSVRAFVLARQRLYGVPAHVTRR